MSLLSGVSSQSPRHLLPPWPAWVWTVSSVSGYPSHLFLCIHCARALQVISALLFANLLWPSEPSLQRPPSQHASCFLICPCPLPLLLTMFEAYQLFQGGPQTICVGPSVGTAGTDTETIVTTVEVCVTTLSSGWVWQHTFLCLASERLNVWWLFLTVNLTISGII